MLSLSGLATFGTAAVNGYNAKKAELKTEAERLADKQREQTRQDAAEQRANESHKLQQDSGLYDLGQKKVEDTQKLEEFNRTKLIRDGVGSALTAYQAGDLSGAYDAYEQTGNKLHPERQMRFERDANGLIVIDPKTKSAVGQVYDASGNPMGQKMPIAMTQLHSAISSMADPIKYAQSRQEIADAIEKEKRAVADKKDLSKFETTLPMSQADAQKIKLQQQINNQNAARDHGYDNENAARDQGYKVDSTLLEYSLKPTTTTAAKGKKGATGSALDPLLAFSESGGDWQAQNSVMGFGGLSGHFGRGQFSQARLNDAKKAGVIPANMTPQQFLISPSAQMAMENWHIADINTFIEKNGLNQAIGKKINGVPITLKGMQAVAHLGGNAGLKQFIKTNGAYNPSDANGTSLLTYLSKHGDGSTAASAPTQTNRAGNQAAAGIMSGNVADLNKTIVEDFKNATTPVEGSTVTVGLNRAINSFTKMQRVPDADKQTHFVAGLTEIIKMLPDDMSDADKQTYANSVAYKLLGEGSFQSMSSRLYPSNGQQSAPSGRSAADQQLVDNPMLQNQPPASIQKPATAQAKPEPAPFSPDAMKAGMSYLTADLTDLTPKDQAKPEPKLKLPTKKADPVPVAKAPTSTITMDSPKDDLAKRVAKREAAAKQAALRAAAEQQRLEKAKAEQKAQAIADAKAKTKDDEERKKRRQAETTQTRSTLILPTTGNKWMAQ